MRLLLLLLVAAATSSTAVETSSSIVIESAQREVSLLLLDRCDLAIHFLYFSRSRHAGHRTALVY